MTVSCCCCAVFCCDLFGDTRSVVCPFHGRTVGGTGGTVPNLVCFGLWGLGFLGRRERRFTMAPTRSARRHGAPTTRTCLLAAAPSCSLNEENGATFATDSGPSPFCRSAAVSCVLCIAYRVSWGATSTTHRRGPDRPSLDPRFELIATKPASASATPYFLHRPRLPASCPIVFCPHCHCHRRCLCLYLCFFLSLFSVTLTSSETSPLQISSPNSPLLPHLSSLTFHPSPLTSQSSVLTTLTKSYQASAHPHPHDEALPFVLARAGPIRLWRRLCAPP